MSALVLDGVSRVFDVGGEQLVALDGVDLEVPDGEVLALVGPSGSGKTTLLSIAGGLLTPTAGRVVVGGQDISAAGARQLTAFRRDHVGFIFQSVNLIPFLTARENLLVIAELAGRDLRRAGARADRLLEELGLGHRHANLPDQLSGGERQRVAIGRALMNEPALVLVDEPTASLDTRLGEQVMALIVGEVTRRGAAAVVVTHDPRMAAYATTHRRIGDGRLHPAQPSPSAPALGDPTPAGRRDDEVTRRSVTGPAPRPAAPTVRAAASSPTPTAPAGAPTVTPAPVWSPAEPAVQAAPVGTGSGGGRARPTGSASSPAPAAPAAPARRTARPHPPRRGPAKPASLGPHPAPGSPEEVPWFIDAAKARRDVDLRDPTTAPASWADGRPSIGTPSPVADGADPHREPAADAPPVLADDGVRRWRQGW